MEKNIVHMCGPQAHKQQKVSERGIPILQEGAINVYTILPCPLKVRFKKEFEVFIDNHNRNSLKQVYCPTIQDGSPKGIEGMMKTAKSEDELPEVLVTTGFNTIFSKPFKQKYLATGVFEGLTKPAFLDKMPDDYKRIASQYNIGFLAFGSWSLICDMSIATDMIFPRQWTDLAKPEFKNQLSIHGYQGKASGTSLLLVLKERMGNDAIKHFAENIKDIRHFAEIIKRIDSPDNSRAPFNILPNAASVQIPSQKKAAMIEFQDGPLMAPLMMFVKKSKKNEAKPVTDFFWSDTFRSVLAKGDFYMPDEMDWTQKYTFPSWDYLASQDFEELSESLGNEFNNYLKKDI